MDSKGSIVLVGAGPGDPELLTLRAIRAIEHAEVILYDALVSEAVLAYAPASAEKLSVGKKGHGPSCRQDDINRVMVEYALAGKRVVRLKGGDPTIFSRAGEEIEAARAANITIEIIPGITTAQAAAAALCTPLTHRHHARRLQFVTGHDNKGALPSDIDWNALADPSATTIVYMAKKTLRALCEKAIAHGLDKDTPAALVMDASLPTQRTLRGTVATLPDLMEHAQLEGAVIVLFGRSLL
jgi:uroporphyrin-III C-methyltransferase / precorrin-2 dehydrogenase / sirohydrochlorin ferrochelatase